MKVRKTASRRIWLLAVIGLFSACSDQTQTPSIKSDSGKDETIEKLKRQKDAIVPFFSPIKIETGDWLENQKEQRNI